MPPSRRYVLRSLAGGLPVVLAGCAAAGSFGEHPDRAVVDSTFEPTGSGDAMQLAERARVEWDDENDQIVVTGFIWFGSSSCNRPNLAGVTYDGDADRLTVVTSSRHRTPQSTVNARGERTCTADLSGSIYTVRVAFDGGLPRHVVVKQFHNGHDATETRATRRW